MNDEIVASPSSATTPPHSGPVYLWAAIVLGTFTALLRLVLARPVRFCGTPDACFYLGLAQTLSSTHHFQARFLYNFQQAHPTLPNTGLEYWRPGVSLLLLLLKPFGAVTLQASIVLTTLAGLALAAAAWHIASRTSTDRRLALGSFALCLVLSPVWIGSTSPDSSLYYGAAVAWFLAWFTVARQGLLQDLLALACLSLAYLIRNDAALLLVPFLAVLWARHTLWRRSAPGVDAQPATLQYSAAMLAGFVLALVPMHALYKSVLGTAFPSGTAQALYLNDLSDFGRYRDPVGPHSLLAHGLGHLVTLRIATLATIVYRVSALMIGYPALLFLLTLFVSAGSRAAAGTERPERPVLPELRGPVAFGLAVLLAYGLVLPAIGGFSALRTAVALLPWISVLVVVAVFRAARTPGLAAWLTGGLVAANAIAGVMETHRDIVAANVIGSADRAEAAELARTGAAPQNTVVLTGDPVQFSVTTGYATVALPGNGLDAIAAAVHDFQITHVILDSENLPASADALQQQLHPVRSITLAREHSLILELPGNRPRP